ncbi:hypothetical protein BV25DRAFT_1041711 [Artomyces pyxidatus]|uniref:Uncharacterized protein n=1 Tax=Artomyces pyxidatus TaxID=48021 RepID=A0ACB8SU47_9AGAM|nr:hypothetical protein BV25DRAFT_1041711 [Artomyces pyxidatus]
MGETSLAPNLAQLSVDDDDQELSSTAISPSLTPIFTLPVETLTEIFSYLPCHIPELRAEHGVQKNPRWLSVTQVCSHWRRVAHACRELWVVLPLENKHWTGLALELSHGSPLIVNVNEPEGVSSYAAVSLALKYTQQICQVSWVASCRSRLNRLLDDVGPVPQLESFTFSIADDEINGGTPDLTPILAFPVLRKVHVRGASFGNTRPLLFSPTVTDLTFIDVDVGATLADLIATLRGLRKLERLILRDCFPLEPLDNSSPLLIPIVLPHLITLSLSGDIADVSDTLALITAPACQELSLECICFDFVEEAIRRHLTSMLADRDSSSVMSSQNSYQALRVLSSSKQQTYFQVTHPLVPFAGLPEQLNLILHHWERENLEREEYVCAALPLGALQRLNIGLLLFKTSWHRVFAHFVQLHDVTINDDTMSDVAATPRWQPPSPDAQLAVIPRPISVVVEDVHFLSSPLMLGLMSRVMESGNGRFRSLELRNCVISPSSVKDLQDKFGADVVHWDGVSGRR